MKNSRAAKWNPSNVDSGEKRGVLISGIKFHEKIYLEHSIVSKLIQRCPYFRGVL